LANREIHQKRRKPIKLPSVYRYMALGLVLPIFVSVGMLLGYNYGQAYGEFLAWTLAAVGSIVGLIVATALIVKVVLFWDRGIKKQVKARETRQPREDRGKRG
jgi:chromate transport protein ChrA